MAKIRVTPNRDDLPPHPIDGKLPPDGGLWTADQYTFRLIRDGDIAEVVEPEAKAAPPPPDHDKTKKPR
jgi:hypothetical protein